MKPIAATTVEPDQSIEVVVTLKIGLAAGTVVHRASIETEESDGPAVDLITTATIHARVTVEEVGGGPGRLDPGQSRRVEYVIRSFGRAASDLPPPLADGAIRCALPTEWVGPATTETDSRAGLAVIRRTLAVTLPASSEPQHRLESFEILDEQGGVVGRHFIKWEVAATLLATPSGLVFTGDTAEVADGLRVVIRSRDSRPFRVLSANCEIAELRLKIENHDIRSFHHLVIRLDGSRGTAPRSSEIIVRTDRTDQPVIKISVYLAGQIEAKEKAR